MDNQFSPDNPAIILAQLAGIPQDDRVIMEAAAWLDTPYESQIDQVRQIFGGDDMSTENAVAHLLPLPRIREVAG